jgi:DNA-binding NarL/FixJ family response regulator
MVDDINQQFTQREQDVIALLLMGRSNQQIALELGIVVRTV